MSDARARIEEDSAPGSAEPRCSLEHAEKARKNYCGTVRAPAEPDEQGAVNIVELVFAGPGKRDRIAFFEIPGAKQCRVVFLDRASKPRAHASAAMIPDAAPSRQSVAPRTSQPGDALPLFGTPGCSVPDTCAPAAPAPPLLKLVCTSCGAKPKPGVLTLEGGTHYRTVEHGAGIPGRKPSFLAKTCGKWRRV